MAHYIVKLKEAESLLYLATTASQEVPYWTRNRNIAKRFTKPDVADRWAKQVIEGDTEVVRL
jgi:hypothetical protein